MRIWQGRLRILQLCIDEGGVIRKAAVDRQNYGAKSGETDVYFIRMMRIVFADKAEMNTNAKQVQSD